MELREPKVLQLLGYLSPQAMLTPGQSATEKALFSTDGFAFSLEWQTGLRGMNASETRLKDLELPGLRQGLCCSLPRQQPKNPAAVSWGDGGATPPH